MDADAILTARSLRFCYQKEGCALDGVDLSVRPGMTMILGRSGSGKTTLLKVLTGILNPQQGQLWFSPLLGKIAYIPQNLGLVRNLSALENTLTGALSTTPTFPSLLGIFPRRTLEQARAILEDLGLGDKADEKVSHLSGGERQRVAIARALMLNPKLILADEFISLLDAVTTREILDRMRGMEKQGTNFMITTHETDLVSEYADQIVVMRRGQVVYSGTGKGASESEWVGMLR